MWIFKSDLSAERFLKSGGEYAREYLSQLDKEYELNKDEAIEELSFELFMEYSRSGNRLAYEDKYFRRRMLLRDFALKAWLGDEGAVKRLENVMLAICAEHTWVLPAHLKNTSDKTIDLFSAETAHALTEIISLIGDKLTNGITERCISEVSSRVLDPFMKRTKPYGWENSSGNWCAVCGGCIGMTAIYLIEDNNILNSVIDSLRLVFKSYLDSFSDDGACLEGLYYWNYGMLYFTSFIDLYRQRIGSDFEVNTDKVKKIADFPSKCCIGSGITVSISDGYERDKIYSGLMHKLYKLYSANYVESEYFALLDGDACARWCKAARDIAWNDGTIKAGARASAILPDAQWAVLNSGNISVVFKGGSNGEPHNHNDVGNIAVMKNGEMLICDLGAGEYTADYFSQRRYDIFCNSSEGHSVPIINGMSQKAGHEFCAEDFFAENSTAGADISGAYGLSELISCARKVTCEDKAIILEDRLIFTNTADVTERFITRFDAELDNNTVKIIADGIVIGQLVSENECEVEIKRHIHNEHDGKISNVTSIDFRFIVNKEYTFLVKML